ncbi:hypothetical protein TrCOL_g1932 [Triparma columacea]|uniref:Uncharacterized protein n=1 Tax=Triparma columacea TaxID=722753 RepID=A0A9W7G3W7_9STRA|nr:hypothetical protein TrCOL_g1932 [Triparma columacea]
MWDDDGFGWDEAEVVIHKRMDSRALETSSEGDKTFTLAHGQVFLQVSFILDPGCYDISTITERQSSSGGGWAIVQVFSDFNTNLKRRTLGGDDANWLCTAGFTLPKRCKDNPTAMDCQDQERAKSELKNRGIAVPSPSPTAQVDPQPQTVQTDTGDSSTDPVVYGVAGALILSAVAVGATVLTMRRRRRLSLEEDDNPWVTNTPLSPPTMKVVRAMDGNSHLVE